MKKFLSLALMLTLTLAIYAMPAKPVKKTLTLADGTQVQAVMVGDEHGHWFVDEQGKALQCRNGIASYLSDTELQQLKATAKKHAQSVEKLRQARLTQMHNLNTPQTRASYSGQKKGIVILVNFKDRSFNSAHTRAMYDDRFNKEGYTTERGCVGSVHDYFYDQSYGKLDIKFDVVGPVTLSKISSYYGQNDDYGVDAHAAEMVIDAIKAADSDVNYKDYDSDGDGEVDQVVVVFAGVGEATGDAADVYPAQYDLDDANYYGDGTGIQTRDGVKLNTYVVVPELAGTDSSNLDGIASVCHEFSHCFGLADLYDRNYYGAPGMGYWDLMSSGTSNGPDFDGEVPPSYTSFEKMQLGWLTPIELTDAKYISGMKPITSSQDAYIIYNQARKTEYYMLENRQLEKWDSYTNGHGMMILYVDYNADAWYNDNPNSGTSATAHQRMTFIPADNDYGTLYDYGGYYYTLENANQMAGDPWPGTSGNTAFTDTSTPAATLYYPNSDKRRFLGKPIENIKESGDGLISFCFNGAAEDGIEVIAADSAGDGKMYNLQGQQVDSTAKGVVIQNGKKFVK